MSAACVNSTRHCEINNISMRLLCPGFEATYLGSLEVSGHSQSRVCVSAVCMRAQGTIKNVSLLFLSPKGLCLKLSAAMCGVSNTVPEAAATGYNRCQAVVRHGLWRELLAETLVHFQVIISQTQ